MKNLRIIGAIVVGLSLISCEKEFVEEEFEVTTFENKKSKDINSKKRGKKHKIDICHNNGHLINVGIPSAFSHLKNGGQLFSCDPIDAVTYEDLRGYLKIKVFNEGGNFNDTEELENAFEDWYINDYLTGNWLIVEDNENTSGGGTGSGGIGGGSL